MIRPILVIVLTVSALKLLGASNIVVLLILGGVGLGVAGHVRMAPVEQRHGEIADRET